ncbi:HAD-IC family P-type ATPase [Patescibacteria group bacterium]|nr:HAD-IC family P-type ATPase [Patescibacteria group bacterium]MBU0777432.1 HAD-IC family P-type ATPase [Patescibacteria group bacterium]MBU0846067.1 HAD-IC family P-type ATPase [Patescibacteria group bacterium]MBU0923120.1 HAD-IC family P-type ATPase [Patescibacteria group bacterium]MBU1066835.1 HAD-IC family P-type ATPase [Patescibacteria group bacterium]
MPPEQKGLTSKEAAEQRQKHGPNILPEKPPPSDLIIFISQLKNPLVYVLVAAGVVTFFLNHRSDTAIIFFAVFLNTILGFFQERRASKALFALKKLIHPEAQVIRNGHLEKIDVSEVVPGDIVVLGQGEKIPADGKLVEVNKLFVSEAILTGESVSVAKKENDKAFMGTIVVSGQAKMIVEITGEDTEIGKIAEKIQEPSQDTPLRVQLKTLSKQLSLLVLGLTAIVFVVGMLKGLEIIDLFTTAVALAVSSIPEGLLVGLTVVLAIGMQRILKRKGLVRNLVSAETLGSVTVICVDKTGTLTEGKMRVVDAIGKEHDIASQAILANDLDDPLLIAAWEWAGKKLKNSKSLRKKHTRITSIPFTSKNRFFASLSRWKDGGNMLFVNGAPEFLIEWSTLSKKEKQELNQTIKELSSHGKRLIGMARKKVPSSYKEIKERDVKKDLEWVGLLAFSDPVRPGVGEAFKKTRAAGVKFLVITGDYPQTAISVMDQLGIACEDNCVVLGEDVAKLNVDKLAAMLIEGETKLFARTTPEHKLKIVEALKKNGEVVAMMGDGVNDAPALKKADIGIVVGEATDVAKETADLILLDSSFATIVEAIEEGRGIFDNIRKIILYLMSDAFEEIVAVLGTLILGLPLAVTAGQILWINLISDGFPDLALTVDPRAPDIMKRAPRSSKEPIVNTWMKDIILIVSLVGGIVALALFIYFYKTTGELPVARSIAFATLGVNSLVYVFSIRTLTVSFWKGKVFANRWLNIAVLAGLVLQVAPFLFEFSRDFLGIVPLTVLQWAIVFSASILMFIIIETAKVLFRGKPEWFQG